MHGPLNVKFARYCKRNTGFAVHLISTVTTIEVYVAVQICVLCGRATMCVGMLRRARKIIEETLSVNSPTYEKFWPCKWRRHHSTATGRYVCTCTQVFSLWPSFVISAHSQQWLLIYKCMTVARSSLLGAFARLRKASSCLSVCPSAWKNSVPT